MADWVVIRMLMQKHEERRKPKAKAGWFRDPRHEAPYRFWDGARWTVHTADSLTEADPTL